MDINSANELIRRIESDTERHRAPDSHILSEISLDPMVLRLVAAHDRVGQVVIAVMNGAQPTPRQKAAIEDTLKSQYGSARAVIAAALGAEESALVEKTEPTQEAIKVARTTAAAEYAAFIGAKPLKGTEKQVAWAETIRANRLKALPTQDAQRLLKLKGAGSAKFWIDSRFDTTEQMLAGSK